MTNKYDVPAKTALPGRRTEIKNELDNLQTGNPFLPRDTNATCSLEVIPVHDNMHSQVQCYRYPGYRGFTNQLRVAQEGSGTMVIGVKKSCRVLVGFCLFSSGDRAYSRVSSSKIGRPYREVRRTSSNNSTKIHQKRKPSSSKNFRRNSRNREQPTCESSQACYTCSCKDHSSTGLVSIVQETESRGRRL
jgi:hypothetical protein